MSLSFRQGSSVSLWPRVATVTHRELPIAYVGLEQRAELVELALGRARAAAPSAALRAALGAHLEERAGVPDDPWVATRWRELDESYASSLPGFAAAASIEIELAERLLVCRRLFAAPRQARVTLPASVARRALILSQGSPGRIYIEDDVDGLALLLGRSARVTVAQSDDTWRQWLGCEVERAGCAAAVSLAGGVTFGGAFDLALVQASGPAETHAALSRALAATRSGGLVAVAIRSPADESFWPLVEGSGLELVAYHRDCDHAVVPGGFVIDGGADLALFRRPADVRLAAVGDAPGLRQAAEPYLVLDFESLAVSRLDRAALARFADLVAATSSRPEAMRANERHGVRETLCWYDEAGFGFSAELRRDREHLQIALLPFDGALEYAVLFAVYHALADEQTRMQPSRTRRGPEGRIL